MANGERDGLPFFLHIVVYVSVVLCRVGIKIRINNKLGVLLK